MNTLIRTVLMLALIFTVGMLYWSSLLVEEREITLSAKVSHLEQEIQNLQSRPIPTTPTQTPVTRNSHIDDKLPNLLQEDPFYKTTLPNMLGKDFHPEGNFQQAVIGKPQNLHPFTNWAEVASWQSLCGISLSKLAFGRFETMAPYMATKIESRERKDPKGFATAEFWVHLRDDIFWEPLEQQFFPNSVRLAPTFLMPHQVTAHDFVFYFNAFMNPHVEEPGAVSLRTYYEDIESIEALDDFTLIVRWKPHELIDANGKKIYKIKYLASSLTGGLIPLPRFVFQYFSNGSKILDKDEAEDTYRTSAIWAQNFSTHWARNIIVSCGPWIFDGMSDREIKFKRNLKYPIPFEALTNNHTVSFKETPNGIWQSFKTNQLSSYVLQAEELVEYTEFLKSDLYRTQKADGAEIKRLDYVGRAYSYIGWNQAKPFFTSKKVRQALTMAIDRNSIIEKNLKGLGIPISCPFYLFSPSCDKSIAPWPYDLSQAQRLLEEEGWFDSDGDGILDKVIDGKRVPFQFTLTYYVKSNTAKAICEYIATNFQKIKISCQLNGVDTADLSAIFEDKSFDAILMGWSLGSPPEDPKQLWSSSGAHEKGSSNAVGFSNAEADKIIEALQFESDSNERLKLYHRFDAIIHEEAPYTFLYSPKVAFIYRNALQNVFLPVDRQDLIPGANIAEPDSSIFWLKQRGAL